MKVRYELSGVHLFDRMSGMHVLLDEIGVKPESLCYAPRTLSIALTNACDLACHFCYAPKSRHQLTLEYLKELVKHIDELGTLEVTLGGGEPLLHPDFSRICNWIWENTKLAVSVTTHGHHFTPELISELSGRISCVRFSIDGIEPRYSQIRRRKLSDLIPIMEAVQKQIPIGINTVVSTGHVEALLHVIELAKSVGAMDLLIIPEHDNGNFTLSNTEWQALQEIVMEHSKTCQLLITESASQRLAVSSLVTHCENEFLFAHVSADMKLKMNSYEKSGLDISNLCDLDNSFKALHG